MAPVLGEWSLRPGGFEIGAVGAAGSGRGGDFEHLYGDFHLLAAGERGGAGELGLERAGRRFVEERHEAQLGSSRDEGGEGGVSGRSAVRDEVLDGVAGGPAAALDRTMIEDAVGDGFEFELAAVGFQFGEVLLRTLMGGGEDFQCEFVQFE